MRYGPFFLLLLLGHHGVWAQCSAFAGQDTIICNSWNGVPPLMLGGNPVVTGGEAPYTYTWSAHHSFTIGANSYTFSASDFLDDTTSANPYLVDPLVELYYTLTVTDANGAQCMDSVFVRMANLGTHLGYMTATIMAGDSFQFFFGANVSGTYEPFSYVWHPNESLSDSTSLTAWASPLEYTAYSLTGTDSYGCTATAAPLYFINVIPVSVGELDDPVPAAVVVPVPMRDHAELRLNLDAGPLRHLLILSADGRLVRKERITASVHAIPRAGLAAGVYHWNVVEQGAVRASGRLVVE